MQPHRKNIRRLIPALTLGLAIACAPIAAADAGFALDQLRLELTRFKDRALDLQAHRAGGELRDADSRYLRAATLRAQYAAAPNDATAVGLAEAELRFGMLELAADRLSVLESRIDPTLTGDLLCLQARIAHERDKPAEALALFELSDPAFLGERRDDCLLLKGIALQAEHRQRESITVFEQVTPESPRYPIAQFNLALAEMRNGWWSDAERRIEKLALSLPEDTAQERVLVDRFYTTAGYSRLERDYYRQAREAFRKVSRTGPYSDRALLGLALAALEQQKYSEARRLAEHLAARSDYSLPADEAQLITPYALDRMRRDVEAKAAYETAIGYFEHRLRQLEVYSRTLDTLDTQQLRHATQWHHDVDARGYTEIQAMHADLDEIRAGLGLLAASGEAQALRADARRLEQQLVRVHRAVLIEAAGTYRGYLHSYLNQARYGLAHLLDRSSLQQASP